MLARGCLVMLKPPVERVILALTDLMAHEKCVELSVAGLRDDAMHHPGARELLFDLEKMARYHLDTLRERRQTPPIDDPEPQPLAALERTPFVQLHPVSGALRVAYTVIQDAVLRYSLLEPISHRALDSWAMANEGTTSHIGRQHTQDYMALSGRITAFMHDVVLWELDRDGFYCGCTCPCCSIGLCLCAVSSRSILSESWMAAKPPVAEQGIEVMPPRPGSAVAAAGFIPGDVIVSIDGERVDSTQVLQRVVRDHQPSDLMEVRVRRKAGEVTIYVEHRREGGVDMNEDECILPAGQHFYLDQARDLRRRLRKQRSSETADRAALATLSPRELQVLRLLALGATNPLIADELEISRATVARHVAAILAKLGLANRTEAAALAAQAGLLSLV